ncbi:MAG: helix-turn-helix domain-containing protein [Lachnospiraceae bacterium]|nr:helix-turn-helix domain-containing protein [Lachnospiraceae bacterium]
MNETTLLLLDAAKTRRESLENAALKLGPDIFVIAFESEADVMRYLRDERADLILVAASDDGNIFASLKRLHAIYPDCPAAVCIEEKTYENVKRAMEAGAFDCLTLPFSPDELSALLQRIEELHRLFGGGTLKRPDRSDMTQHMFVTRLMQGKVDAQMLKDEAERVHIRFFGTPCFVIVVALDPRQQDFRQEEPILRLIPYLENRVSLLVRGLSEEYGHTATVYSAGTSYEWLHLILQTEAAMTQDNPFIGRVLEGIVALNKELDNCILTAAVCQAVPTTQGIYRAHRTADRLLHNRHIDRLGTIFYEDANVPPVTEETLIPVPDRELSRQIRSGNEAEALKMIRGVYALIREDGNISLESCRFITLNLAVAVCKADNSGIAESALDMDTLKQIMHMRVLADMEECVTGMAKEIVGKRVSGNNRKAYLANEALDYVHTHYSDPGLTLKKVSDALGISIPYLTVIFRNENHTTFTTQLTETRIERAKELLLSTNRLVNTIAREVGFSSSQYFSATFRKYTGMSPEAFRGKESKRKSGRRSEKL